jgi:transposase
MDTSTENDSPVSTRPTRRIRTYTEKLQILKEAAEPGASVALVARKHGMNANLLFAWRRLHSKGLLEAQRHAPPLLPVKISSPTITPTRQVSSVAERLRKKSAGITGDSTGTVEIIFDGEVRVRLLGAAAQKVLTQILDWLPRR